MAGAAPGMDRIMTVIAFSRLAVMPVVWLADWISIALGYYAASTTIPIHAAVSVWEMGLMAVGFAQMEALPLEPPVSSPCS